MKNFINFLSKYKVGPRIYILCIVLIIYLAFFMRINGFGYPYLNEDGNRDYLVAHHIVSFGELPLNGPLGQFPNSPLYYYFLALILFIHDSVMFLLIVNIFMQVAGLLSVYLLAEKLFSKQTALIALIIFAFSDAVLIQSRFIFQPHVMMPFANLSFFLLALAYIKKNYCILLSGVCLFIFAGVLHNAVFALVPSLILVIVLIHRKSGFSSKYYALTSIVAAMLLDSFYLPLVLLSGSRSLSPFLGLSFSNHFGSLADFLPSFYGKSKMFVELFFLKMDGGWTILAILVAIALCFMLKKKDKTIFAIFVFSVIQFLVVASLLRIDFPFPDRYFMPIFGLFIILIAESIVTIFSEYNFLLPLKIIAVVFLYNISSSVHISSILPTQFLPATISVFASGNILHSYNVSSKNIDHVVDVIKNEILSLQDLNNAKEPNFFQFHSYLHGSNYYPIEAAFWVPLERDLGHQFTRVDDHDLRGYKTITSDDYIFLICPISEVQGCQNKFFSQNTHRLVKFVVEDPNYKIFLAKKIIN